MNRVSIIILVFVFFGNYVFPQESSAPAALPSAAILNAAYIGNADLVKQVLALNPDRDVRDSLGGTAIHVAVLQNNIEVIKLLLDDGFDVNAVVPEDGYPMLRGYTPLHYCVWTNNVEAARILLQYKANKNIRASDGMSPQEKAAKEGKRDFLLLFARY